MTNFRFKKLPEIEEMIDILRLSALEYFQTRKRSAIRRFLDVAYTQYCRICASPQAAGYIKEFKEYFGDSQSTPLAISMIRHSYSDFDRRDLYKWKTLIELAHAENTSPGKFAGLLQDHGGVNGALAHLKDIVAERRRRTMMRKSLKPAGHQPNNGYPLLWK